MRTPILPLHYCSTDGLKACVAASTNKSLTAHLDNCLDNCLEQILNYKGIFRAVRDRFSQRGMVLTLLQPRQRPTSFVQFNAAFVPHLTHALRYPCFRGPSCGEWRCSLTGRRIRIFRNFNRSPRGAFCVMCKKGSGRGLERLMRRISGSYELLEPEQKLYVQVCYMVLVTSVMLSISASLVRLYKTLAMIRPL